MRDSFLIDPVGLQCQAMRERRGGGVYWAGLGSFVFWGLTETHAERRFMVYQRRRAALRRWRAKQ